MRDMSEPLAKVYMREIEPQVSEAAAWPLGLLRPQPHASGLASPPLLFRPQRLKCEAWWAVPSTPVNMHRMGRDVQK